MDPAPTASTSFIAVGRSCLRQDDAQYKRPGVRPDGDDPWPAMLGKHQHPSTPQAISGGGTSTMSGDPACDYLQYVPDAAGLAYHNATK